MVCTANIARSPLAAALLGAHATHRLGADHDIVVESAGVQAREGDAVADGSQAIAQRWGLDLTAHRSRPVTPQLLVAADLVLTMSGGQRDVVGRLGGSSVTRTFALRELTRLAGRIDTDDAPADPAKRVVWAAHAAHEARPVVAAPGGHEDVADPFGRAFAHYVTLGNELVRHAEVIADLLFGRDGPLFA